MADRDPWSDDEMILALAMYLDPQGTRKGDIRIFMEITGRTEGSINYRWGNYAACDKEYLKSGRKGFPHGGPKVERIWKMFQDDPVEMFTLASNILENNGYYREMTFLEDQYDPIVVNGGGVIRQVRQRIGQDSLRRTLLVEAGSRCSVTGIKERQILRCSHIVPWSQCATDEQKTSLDNVLCLNTFHDSLFDRHLMTVDEDRCIHYAPVLKENMNHEIYRTMCDGFTTLHVRKIAPNPEYLQIHNREFEKTAGVKMSET